MPYCQAIFLLHEIIFDEMGMAPAYSNGCLHEPYKYSVSLTIKQNAMHSVFLIENGIAGARTDESEIVTKPIVNQLFQATQSKGTLSSEVIV